MQDGADRASLLVGIKIADDVADDDIPALVQEAVGTALEVASLDGTSVEAVAPARQMAYAN